MPWSFHWHARHQCRASRRESCHFLIPHLLRRGVGEPLGWRRRRFSKRLLAQGAVLHRSQPPAGGVAMPCGCLREHRTWRTPMPRLAEVRLDACCVCLGASLSLLVFLGLLPPSFLLLLLLPFSLLICPGRASSDFDTMWAWPCQAFESTNISGSNHVGSSSSSNVCLRSPRLGAKLARTRPYLGARGRRTSCHLQLWHEGKCRCGALLDRGVCAPCVLASFAMAAQGSASRSHGIMGHYGASAPGLGKQLSRLHGRLSAMSGSRLFRTQRSHLRFLIVAIV